MSTWPIWSKYLFLLLPIVASFSNEGVLPSGRSSCVTTCTGANHYGDTKSAVRAPRTALRATYLTLPRNIQSQSIQNAVSDELLRLLKQKAAVKPNPPTNNKLDNEINSLVRTLIASKTTFDPKESLNGPLFATVHFIGNTPLWEKIAVGGTRNVKGQKYTLLGDTSGSFVNYAEIWGNKLFLKAVGKFNAKGLVSSSDESESEAGVSNNPFDFLTSLFDKSQSKTRQIPTPYDYEAIVSGASIVLFNKFLLDVAIEGTGTVQVLYADPNLRIFLSPTDTNVTAGGGDWESAGLIVVQVRVDLVYGDWVDRTTDT